MDINTVRLSISPIAILIATAASFALGYVWYSPKVFGKMWMKEVGMTEEKAKKANMAKIMGGAFILSFISATVVDLFLGPSPDLIFGITAGAMTGIGWVCTAFGLQYLYEQRSMRLFLINAGYEALIFIVMGAILGAWG